MNWDRYSESSESSSTIINKNKIHTISKSKLGGFGMRAIVGKKVGFAFSSNPLDEKETLKTAKNLARFSKLKMHLEKFKNYKMPKNIFDKKIENFNMRETIYQLKSACESVAKKGGVVSEALAHFESEKTEYENSLGVRKEFRKTLEDFGLEVVYKGNSGFWYFDSCAFFDNFQELANKAFELAKKSSIKKQIKTGKYDVIFHPFALYMFMPFGVYPNFKADNIQKKKSKLCGKIGKQVFSEKLTIVDNGLLASGICSRLFDGDGVPSQKTKLVENGILKGFLYDLASAQKEKKESTGNAARSYSSLPKIMPSNFVISLGKKDLLKEMDRGFVVYSLLNTNSTNSVSGDFSWGANLAFWVEKGEIKFAPKQIMLSGNIFELFKNIKNTGNDVVRIGSLVSPSIEFKNVDVIGS